VIPCALIRARIDQQFDAFAVVAVRGMVQRRLPELVGLVDSGTGSCVCRVRRYITNINNVRFAVFFSEVCSYFVRDSRFFFFDVGGMKINKMSSAARNCGWKIIEILVKLWPNRCSWAGK
jgi:hypothetical protein